jgi:hypothetical protein
VTVEFAHITPISLLQRVLTPEDTFHLVISDLIRTDERYRSYYQHRRRQGDFVVLDSPAFETGKPTSVTDTIAAVRHLRPSEVVLPDDLTSADETVRLAYATTAALKMEDYKGRFMVVPHGDTFEEYLECAEELIHIGTPQRTTVGVVEEITELFKIPRATAIGALAGPRFQRVPIHLLGVSEDLHDVSTQWGRYTVRSCDTAKFVVWGLNKVQVHPDKLPAPPYPVRSSVGGRTEYFHYRTDDQVALETVRLNIRNWRLK